jgi:hypothetical protein
MFHLPHAVGRGPIHFGTIHYGNAFVSMTRPVMNGIHLALPPSSSARHLRNHGEQLLLEQTRSSILAIVAPKVVPGFSSRWRDVFLPQSTAPPCLQLTLWPELQSIDSFGNRGTRKAYRN